MFSRPWRALLATGAALLVLVAGLLAPTAAQAQPMPTGASRVYKWGRPSWHDEFETTVGTQQWWSNHPRRVMHNHIGMLTLEGATNGSPVYASLQGHSFTYGRWEVRMRIREWNQLKFPYNVTAQLVPAQSSSYHCGDRNITFADYTNWRQRAYFSSRNNTLNRQFTFHTHPYVGWGQWNTYAVELRPHRISWFVDDQLVMTTRSPHAVPNIPYRLRFRIQGPGSGSYRAPWLQMDWARYFDLHLPNAHHLVAPSATSTTFASKC